MGLKGVSQNRSRPTFLNGPILPYGLSLTDFQEIPSYATGSTGVTRLQFSSKAPFHAACQQLRMVGNVWYNAGKAGDTAALILARYAADTAKYPQPGTVLFCDGGNDINNITALVASNGSTGIEDVLPLYATGTLALFALIFAQGWNIIMEALPDNAGWSSVPAFVPISVNSIGARTYAQMHAYYRMARWHKELSRYLGLMFINLNVGLVYPGRQLALAATSLVGDGTTMTVTMTAPLPADLVTGHAVVNPLASPTFAVLSPVQITVTGASTFTYASTQNGTAGIPGSFQRVNVDARMFTVPSVGVHFNQMGEQRLKWVQMEAIQGSSDWLTESEQDGENLIGVGQSGTSHNFLNCGQMQSSAGGGTFTGTWTSTSAVTTVARGWDVQLVNTPTGTTTCTASLVAFPASDPGRPLMQYQQLAIAAGTQDAHVRLRVAHTVPSAWSAGVAPAVGAWRSPTVANGFYYNVMVSGTAAGTEPVWPTTPGVTIIDGGITWECRRAPNYDGITKYRIGGDFRIISQSTTAALLSRCLLLIDDSNSYTIGDGESLDQAGTGSLTVGNPPPGTLFPPLFLTGEHIHFCSPDAILRAAGSTTNTFCVDLWIAANTNITIQFARATWYRTGYGIVDSSGNILGAI